MKSVCKSQVLAAARGEEQNASILCFQLMTCYFCVERGIETKRWRWYKVKKRNARKVKMKWSRWTSAATDLVLMPSFDHVG